MDAYNRRNMADLFAKQIIFFFRYINDKFRWKSVVKICVCSLHLKSLKDKLKVNYKNFILYTPTIHHVRKSTRQQKQQRKKHVLFKHTPIHAYLLSHIKGKCNNLKLNLVYAKRGVNKVCMENAFVCDTTTVCLIMEKEKCHI